MSVCNWVSEAARRKGEDEGSEAEIDKDGGKEKVWWKENDRVREREALESRRDWRALVCYVLDTAPF